MKDREGYNPIHWVVKRGSKEALEALLEHKSSIDPKGPYDRTPLHMASFCGHCDIAEMLIKRGANINAQTAKDDHSKTPLHDAVIHTNLDMVQLLASHPSLNVNIRDDQGHTPLWHAVLDGQVEIIPNLMQHSSYEKAPEGDPNSIKNLCEGKIFRNQGEVIKALKENS